MTEEFTAARQRAVDRLEAESRKTIADGQRRYLESIAYLYLGALTLTLGDVDALREAQEGLAGVQLSADQAAAVRQDRGMIEALATCRDALAAVMPELAGAAENARLQVQFVDGRALDQTFGTLDELVGPHGLAFAALRYGAARIARRAAETAAEQAAH